MFKRVARHPCKRKIREEVTKKLMVPNVISLWIMFALPVEINFSTSLTLFIIITCCITKSSSWNWIQTSQTYFITIYPSSELMVADARKWQWKFLNAWFCWYNCWQTLISLETGKASVFEQNSYQRAGWDQGHGSRPPGTGCRVHLSPLSWSCSKFDLLHTEAGAEARKMAQDDWYPFNYSYCETFTCHVPSLLMTRCVNKWLSYGASVCN